MQESCKWSDRTPGINWTWPVGISGQFHINWLPGFTQKRNNDNQRLQGNIKQGNKNNVKIIQL